MRNAHDASQKSPQPVRLRSVSASKQIVLAAITLFALCAATRFESQPAAAFTRHVTLGRIGDSLRAAPLTAVEDFSKFSHSSPKHSELIRRKTCVACHYRKDASPEPEFPRHQDCTGCHIVQFTAAISNSAINPICTICHKAEGLNSPLAPRKSFSQLVDFTAEFDHAQHLKGIEAARPEPGCSFCHAAANRGVAESIPSQDAHKICYSCHSPRRSASKSSSCDSCHNPGSHSTTPTGARSYRLGFSHADHGPNQNLNCDHCHEVRWPGLPQARQVSSIVPVQHRPNPNGCVKCHNGQRAFADQVKGNFKNCRRCHKSGKFGA